MPFKEIQELQEKAIAESKHPVIVILREAKLKENIEIYEKTVGYLKVQNSHLAQIIPENKPEGPLLDRNRHGS